MANEADDDFAVFTPGGTLQLNKPDTTAPATVIPPAARTVPTTVEPSLLSTAWNKIVGGVEPRMNADLKYQADAADRVIAAAKEGYEASKPDLFTQTGPYSRQASDDAKFLSLPTGRFISTPVIDGISQALGILGGTGRGALQMVKEIVAPTDPITSQVGRLDPGPGWNWRDWKTSGAGPLSSDLSVMPDAFGGSPHTLGDITAPVTEAPPGAFYDRESALSPKTLTRLANERAAAAAPNSAAAYATAKVGYKNLEQSGLTFNPDFVDQNINSVAPASPREISRAQAEDVNSPVATQRARLQANFTGKPMTIDQYQGMMEGVKNSALEESAKGSPSAPALWEMYHNLRNKFEGAAPTDLLSGDTTDIQTFRDANKATFQAHKMEDVEDMVAKAKDTRNFTTALQTKVSNFRANEGKIRGWTQPELDALKDAADRGTIGDFLHDQASRLAVSSGGVATGVLAHAQGLDPLTSTLLGMGGGFAANLATAPIRGLVNMTARQRIQNALDILGQSVPPRPLALPEAEAPPPPPPPPRPQPAWGAWDNG